MLVISVISLLFSFQTGELILLHGILARTKPLVIDGELLWTTYITPISVSYAEAIIRYVFTFNICDHQSCKDSGLVIC